MTEIAVVVPTHNRPDMLASTLRSILAQRGVDLTVAVVDDGSSDPRAVHDTIEAHNDKRVVLCRHDVARGVSAARNTGISGTSSEWLAFCDDDDVWAPDKLIAQLTVARSESAEWAYAGDVAVDGGLRVLDGAPPLRPSELVAELEHYNPVPAGSSNVLVRRSVLDTVGAFDSTLRSVGDWDLWIRLARHGLPACVPQPLVGCRAHAITITQNRRLMLAEVGIVARRHRAPVDWARHFRWAAWNSMLEGRRLEALSHYARAVAAGDMVSLGRAAVALAYPAVARPKIPPDDDWTRQADAWLQHIREQDKPHYTYPH
jgi:glycosyltransferase involved in cell wall biosynthesis